jgi:peptidoglycan/xylan/chitin deacetylase (PgdA/CDA1 family)
MGTVRLSTLLACSLIIVAALTSCSGSGYRSERYLAATLPPLNINPVAGSRPAGASPPAAAGTPVAAGGPGAAPTLDALGRVSVPVLLYHHLQVLSADAGTDWQDSTVSPDTFDEEMAYLAAHNYHSISVAALLACLEQGQPLPPNPVIVTFDDAWGDIYTVGYPILQKYGLTATLFVPANWIENVDGVLTWAQLEELQRAGMEIASHSMTHPYLTQSTPDMLTWELQDSKALLEKHSSKPVIALAYPFGLYDENVIQQTKTAGYRIAFTIEPGLWASRDQLLQLPRLNIGYGTDLDTFAAELQPSKQ